MKNLRRAFILILIAALGACQRGGATSGGPAGSPPPMVVDLATVELKPVERTTEFVGTVKSRRSTSLQPQVEGFLTRIDVQSGDRVAPGMLLMEIDSRPQQAGIASL